MNPLILTIDLPEYQVKCRADFKRDGFVWKDEANKPAAVQAIVKIAG